MTYFLYALFLVTLLIFLLLVNRYYSYIEEKRENIIRLHGFLNHTVCTKLRQIGDGIRQCLMKSYQQLDITLQIQGLRENKQRSQFRYEQDRKYNYFLILFFTIMAIFNSIILYQIAIIFSPAADMMSELTSLIQSQNVALESYLQAKSLYLFNSKTPSSPNGINEVIAMINTTEIQFAATARKIEKTITVIGGDFADSFNYMLISDVCNLTKSYMPGSKLLGNCSLDMNYNMLQLGAVTVVNFIVRNVMSAMMDLMKNVVDGCIFFSSAFEDIDDYLYYLYSIYQLLEIKIMDGMATIASDVRQNINIIIFFEISSLFIALLIWLTRINEEKKGLSNLYGQVLQLPQVIFRQNKLILKILEENLTLKL